MLFPRARRFEQVYTELAGADLVMYVVETERYHTFSNGAFELWQAANGARSEEDLAVYVYGDCSEFSRKRVRVGLEQLAEADLLEDEPGFGFSRRQFATLGAAAVLAGLSVVVSITAPVSADGLSPVVVPTPPPVIPDWNTCYSDFRTGACVPGSCCCYPNYDIRGSCRSDGQCPYTCV